MRKIYVCLVLSLATLSARAQYSLTTTTYSQSFDGLGTATSAGVTGGNLNLVNASLNGWFFSEAGASANTTITAGTGSSATGDTYNLGVAAAADRTLGGLQSGNLVPTSGFYFTNNNTSAITSLSISYTGETWRIGATGRTDKLDFQYSTDATSLTTGTWTDVDALDYTNVSAGATASGSLLQSAAISSSISSLNIAVGATVYIRWNSFDASGADDAVGINNFSMTATLAPVNTITTGTVLAPPFVLANCGATASGTVDFTSTDVFVAGNNFTAQLSDDIGSFASPANIGSLALSGNGPSGTINITIPAGTVSGTGYKIRVISDNPAVTGTSSAAFTITQQGIGGCASSHTDYYRSFQTGPWNTLSTWESSPDNSNWITATLVPTQLANVITIRNTHTVNILIATTADQLVIQNGGVLNHTSGAFTINDGIGDDVDIQNGGVFQLSSAGNAPAFSGGSPTVNDATGGTIRVSGTGLTAAGAGVNASNYVYNHQSILEYTLLTPFSSSGVTYFPNAGPSTIPIFRVTAVIGASIGATSATTFNGVFECNGAAVFQSSGDKIFRNGIRGTGGVSAVLASGKFVINGVTAELGGTGSLATPTAGLEIGSAGGTAVTVTSAKTVTGDISLITTNTFVDLGAFNLTVSGSVSGGSLTSYIKTSGAGALIHPAVTTKVFPIGKSSYNPLEITAGGNNETYTARVADGINDPSGAIPTDAVQRTWYLNAGNVTPNVFLKFQYGLAECINSATAQPMNMEILQSDYTVWNLVAGNTTIMSVGSDPYTVTAVAGMGIPASATPYTLGVTNTLILPIDCLVGVRSQKVNNKGLISWDVSTCAEVTNFEIQRSVNNSTYQTIGTVNPVSNQLAYQFTDASLSAGTNLYRIKVNRTGGSYKYSNIVAVFGDSKGLLITGISPNPAIDKASLVINSARRETISLTIYDLFGRTVKQWQVAVGEGSNIVEVPAASLAGGTYHVVANSRDAQAVTRFVKQ